MPHGSRSYLSVLFCCCLDSFPCIYYHPEMESAAPVRARDVGSASFYSEEAFSTEQRMECLGLNPP